MCFFCCRDCKVFTVCTEPIPQVIPHHPLWAHVIDKVLLFLRPPVSSEATVEVGAASARQMRDRHWDHRRQVKTLTNSIYIHIIRCWFGNLAEYFPAAIQRYSDAPLSENPPVDQSLKCYMHCFFRTLIEHEWSHEHFSAEDLDVERWFTSDEIEALENMDNACDTISLEESDTIDCEHAYTVVSCLKAANEEVRYFGIFSFVIV